MQIGMRLVWRRVAVAVLASAAATPVHERVMNERIMESSRSRRDSLDAGVHMHALHRQQVDTM